MHSHRRILLIIYVCIIIIQHKYNISKICQTCELACYSLLAYPTLLSNDYESCKFQLNNYTKPYITYEYTAAVFLTTVHLLDRFCFYLQKV